MIEKASLKKRVVRRGSAGQLCLCFDGPDVDTRMFFTLNDLSEVLPAGMDYAVTESSRQALRSGTRIDTGKAVKELAAFINIAADKQWKNKDGVLYQVASKGRILSALCRLHLATHYIHVVPTTDRGLYVYLPSVEHSNDRFGPLHNAGFYLKTLAMLADKATVKIDQESMATLQLLGDVPDEVLLITEDYDKLSTPDLLRYIIQRQQVK